MSRPLQTFQERLISLNPNRNNLPKRNQFFTGREDILHQLNGLFSVNKTTAITQIFSGLSGIGKTDTALEFCHIHINDYQTILWVNAEDEVNLSSSYSEIVRLLGLVITGSLNSFNLKQNILSVNNWLSNRSNWLLVWDNLQDANLLTQFLPFNHQGHVLVTTTCQSLLGYPYIIDLPKMDVDTGALFLVKRAGLLGNEKALELVSEKDKSVAQKIVQEMNGLSLALSLVGAYLEQTKCTLTDYLSRYKNIRYSTSSSIDNQDFNAHSCITAIYKLSIDKIAQQNLVAVQLLQTCSVLSPSNIPEEIFTGTANLLGDELLALTNGISSYNEVSQLLSNYSLIERNNVNQSFSLSHLLWQVINDLLVDSNIKLSLAENLTKALNYLASKDPQDSNYWPLYQRLLPSSLALAETLSSVNPKFLESAKLFYQLGVYCQNQALFSQSLDCYFFALTSYREIFGDNHASIAITLNNIGEV